MKPARAFLFFLSVVILFILLSRTIKSWRSFVPGQNISPAITTTDRKDTCTKSGPLRIAVDTLATKAHAPQPKDTLSPLPPPTGSEFVYARTDSVRLHNFLSGLKNIHHAQTPLRIVYFGDSQIEGDRITSQLRKKMQEQFGGKGPGLIPADAFYSTAHQLIVNRSDNLAPVLSAQHPANNPSLLFRHSRLVSDDDDGWLRINRIRFLAPQPDYTRLKLFVTRADSCTLRIKSSETETDTLLCGLTRQAQPVTISFEQTPDELKIQFFPTDSVTVTALSLESPSGVMVDNISLRGLCYPPFIQSDTLALQTMLAEIQPSLFVLHFGVNLVPWPSDDYSAFRRNFSKQIRFLKRQCPNVPILIIGVSDMAHQQEGKFEPYTNIHQIKQLQKKIAANTGCIFWDLEAFMGGPGSMINWVGATPALGRKDYTHFTEAGAKKIGDELFRLLMQEYKLNQDSLWSNR